jgi:hypothetical protein
MNAETWCHYVDLEPIRRLRNEGRELIGKTISLTEKRDGENVSVWLDEKGEPHVSSHNLCEASSDIITRFHATNEYSKALLLLKTEETFQKHYILYGELLKEVGPTRIEPRRKKIQWVLFDAWNCEEKRYVGYTALYQMAYHYHIPIVRCVEFFIPANLEELNARIAQYLKWCKRHRREGIVGKDYENQVFFKEKIDVPKLPRLPRQPQLQFPPMPQEKIIRSLQHAYDEVGAENWKNTKVAMPIVAKHFQIEAKEHNYSTPPNMYQLWVNTPLEALTVPRKVAEADKP